MTRAAPDSAATVCGALTRGGVPCAKPPVEGRRRCWAHGGAPRGGARRGNLNAIKHGLYIGGRKNMSLPARLYARNGLHWGDALARLKLDARAWAVSGVLPTPVAPHIDTNWDAAKLLGMFQKITQPECCDMASVRDREARLLYLCLIDVPSIFSSPQGLVTAVFRLFLQRRAPVRAERADDWAVAAFLGWHDACADVYRLLCPIVPDARTGPRARAKRSRVRAAHEPGEAEADTGETP